MNFSERCAQATHLLNQLQIAVDALNKDACELEVSRDDEPVLVRMVQGFLVCNRLSGELLHEQIPHIDQEEPAVGAAMRLAHSELMSRARGAHTDMEIYTKLHGGRSARGNVVPIRHAI